MRVHCYKFQVGVEVSYSSSLRETLSSGLACMALAIQHVLSRVVVEGVRSAVAVLAGLHNGARNRRSYPQHDPQKGKIRFHCV